MPTTRPGFIWSGTEWVAIGQEAVLAPVSYQATAPTSPATGDIWIESDVDVPSIDSAQFLRWRKTMTGGETSLSGNDDSSLPLAYTPGYEQLYINGVLQVRGQDYTATTGTTVTGLIALVANDVVEIFSAVARTVADVYTQGQIETFLSGSVVQVVTGTTATDVSTGSTTYVDTNLTATITPKFATSRILVIVNQFIRTQSVGAGSIRIMRNSTVIWTPGQDYAIASDTDVRQVFNMTYLDSPATTSATVYKTQFNRSTGTVNVNANGTKSQITLMEIRA
jgi:hypothetical protein